MKTEERLKSLKNEFKLKQNKVNKAYDTLVYKSSI